MLYIYTDLQITVGGGGRKNTEISNLISQLLERLAKEGQAGDNRNSNSRVRNS